MSHSRHEVALYDRDDDLIQRIGSYAIAGLDAGEQVLIIATPGHRAALDRLLGARAADAAAAGTYRSLDAAETLATFHGKEGFDEDLFELSIGSLIDDASRGGRGVRAYGEMVALLWSDGDPAAAIQLEELWNAMARHRDFALLCGYPTHAVERHQHLADVDDVCRTHTRIVPPRSYDSPGLPPAEPSGDEVSRVFLAAAAAVPAARRWVRATLAEWGEDDLVPDATLVASELATNVVRHAASAFRVSIARGEGQVRLEIEDLAPAEPVLRRTADFSTGGRGVPLVAAVTVRYGHERTPTGKVVWAEFASTAA
jgi:anti-sigma regulatory factor (Ser/Thr protein kinase)